MRPGHKLSPYVGYLTSLLLGPWVTSVTGCCLANACTWHRRSRRESAHATRRTIGEQWEKATGVHVLWSGSLSVWRRCIQNHCLSGKLDAKVRGQLLPQTHHHANKDSAMRKGAQCLSIVVSRERVTGVSRWLKIKEGGGIQCSNMCEKFYTQQIWRWRHSL